MEKLQDSSQETTINYGSITTVTQLKSKEKEPKNLISDKNQAKSSCFSNYFKCDSAHLHMHCAAISGILPEYGNTVGDSLIVPYLLELGAPVWITSYVWIITPFIDSWMQPIYGKLSDKYTSIPNSCCKFGGRKPLIILFGLFATIGLIVIPQARLIKKYGHIASAIIVCILSYTLMDMSHGDLLIPTRSLLNDLCSNSNLAKYGNEKFTFYQAIGRCLGYLIVSIDWSYVLNKSPTLMNFFEYFHLDHHVAICFTISIFILWIIILFVILSTPNQIERLHSPNTSTSTSTDVNGNRFKYRTSSTAQNRILNKMLITPSGRVVVLNSSVPITKALSSLLSSDFDLVNELEPSSSRSLCQLSNSNLITDIIGNDQTDNEIEIKIEHSNDNDNEETELNDIIQQYNQHWTFPFHFKLYWIIQFLGWGNFAAFSLYFTSFVAVDIYNGNPNSDWNSEPFFLFSVGVRKATSILLISAIIAAFSGNYVIPYLNNRCGVKLVFFIGELVLNILLILLIMSTSNIIYVCVIVWLYGIAIQIHYNNVFIIIEQDLRDIFKSEHRRAYVLSIFNLTILFANVLISLVAGLIVRLCNDRFVFGIAIPAAAALLGDIIVYIVFFVTAFHHMLDDKYRHLIRRHIIHPKIIVDIH